MVEVADRKTMTWEQLRDELTAVGQKVRQFKFPGEHIIEDYPIGGRNRGMCKLTVEWKKGKWRPVSQTTNKFGVWCKPKAGTYRGGFGAVCVPPEGYAGWFYADDHSVGILHVANKGIVLSECPWQSVQRQASSTKISEDTYHAEADPRAVIKAFDIWQQHRRAMRDNIIHNHPATTPGVE